MIVSSILSGWLCDNTVTVSMLGHSGVDDSVFELAFGLTLFLLVLIIILIVRMARRLMYPGGAGRAQAGFDGAGSPLVLVPSDGGSDRAGRASGRKRHEGQLAIFRQFAEASGQGFGMADMSGGIIYANPALCRLLGEERREDLLGTNVARYYPEKFRARLEQQIIPTVVAKRQWVGEMPLRSARGSVTPTIQSIFLITDERDRPLYLANVITDISEHKRAEEGLREREQQLQMILDSMQAGVLIINADTHVIESANPAALDLIGADEDYVVGRTCHEHICPRREGDCPITDWGLEVDRAECSLIKASGDKVPILKTVTRILLNGHDHLLESFIDIGERKRAEEALKESEELLRGTLESTADGILVVDRQGRVTHANARFAEMWRIPQELIDAGYDAELIRAVLDQLEDPEAFASTIQRLYATSEQGFDTLVFKDGRIFERLSSPLIRDGQTVGRVWSFRDVTEQRRAERRLRESNLEIVEALEREKRASMQLEAAMEQLEAATRDARAATRAKSEFLANMSHEIRTPMNGIVGLVELLQRTDLEDEQQKYLQMISQSADSLLNVINDILDLSKIESGKLALDPVDFGLRDCLCDTARAHAVRAHEKGLELVVHALPDVPDALVGDVGRLRQVVVNLVGNAIKFTDRGEIVLRVEVKAQREDVLDLHFSVIDTGIGIPPEKQRLIFEAFSQADGSTTRKYGGTGLGLTVTARLVELMGGRVWVASQVGEGSTFHFTMRFRLQANRESAVSLAEFGERPVLVVSHHATTRAVVAEMLSAAGVRALSVDTTTSALATLRQGLSRGESFALALIDAHSPGGPCCEFWHRMQLDAELRRIPVVLMSAPGQVIGESSCKSVMRPVGHLIKPIKQCELVDIVRHILSASGEDPQGVGSGVTEQAATPVRNLRILLAEDNLINQEVAVSLLTAEGHSVEVAGNGIELLDALDQAGEDGFDLVLMDVQMPVLGGYETTAAIRQREKETQRHIPVIAMTANAMKGDRERCIESGMDDYLAKPIKLDALCGVLAKWAPKADRPARPATRREQPEEGDPLGQAAPPQLPDVPPIDVDAAMANLGGNRRILERVLDKLGEQIPVMLEDIRAAVSARDAAKLRIAAHSLKGAAANVCAEPTRHVAERLEAMGKRAVFEDVGTAFEELEARLGELLRHLEGEA
ncbi:MAG: PAS domain S-box protein [Phycisphaerae bacterium]|nr:PAS domain S-box protein [Phycisphaerae bacterium]